jgi:hypothetical protein
MAGSYMSGGGRAVEIAFDDPSGLRMALVLGCAVAWRSAMGPNEGGFTASRFRQGRREVHMLGNPDFPGLPTRSWPRFSFPRVFKDSCNHPVAPDHPFAWRLDAHCS